MPKTSCPNRQRIDFIRCKSQQWFIVEFEFNQWDLEDFHHRIETESAQVFTQADYIFARKAAKTSFGGHTCRTGRSINADLNANFVGCERLVEKALKRFNNRFD